MTTNTLINTIGLIGHGQLFQRIKHYLELYFPDRLRVITDIDMDQVLSDCRLLLFSSDNWSPYTLRTLNRRCLQTDIAFLPIYTQFAEGIIGPCVIPSEKGCSSCAALRALAATPEDADRELLRHYLFQQQDITTTQPWLTAWNQDTLAHLAIDECNRFIHHPEQLRTQNALLVHSLETLECHRHPFLPLAACPDCGEFVEDSAELATIILQSRPKPDPFTYRAREYVLNAEQLFKRYVDPYTGMIQDLTFRKDVLPIASTKLHTELPDGSNTVTGTGCTLRPEQSKIVATLENLERYAAIRPRGKYANIRASYAYLQTHVSAPILNPETLGLYSQEQYANPPQHLIPYHPDLEYHWVWGYSFLQQSPILVPERCAYYNMPKPEQNENPSFLFDSSNGCALGNCLEEAIFHGILEVAERDAFLLTWYARLSLPRLDPRSISDPTIRLLVEHIEYQTGYTIHVFNATLDHAIPCLWVMGVDEQNRAELPKVRVAAGSHPHPEQALFRALRELSVFLSIPPQWYQQRQEQAREMLHNDALVTGISEHPLIYCLPEAFERFAFFYQQSIAPQTFAAAFADFYQHPPTRMDLRDDLQTLIQHYRTHGIDTIVIDQYTPEYAPDGFRCVKVLMPGMLPMTFGQKHRRLTGFERLYQLPYTLGYRQQPLTADEINPYPHPFA